MNQDRAGALLLLASAGWMALLAIVPPGNTASYNYRVTILTAAIGMLVLIVFPRMQYRTTTAYAFSLMGITLSVGVFGMFGVGLLGLVPAIMVPVAIWLRRDRLDGHVVVVIISVAACCFAIFAPGGIILAWSVIALGNAFIWVWNMLVRQLPGRRINA